MTLPSTSDFHTRDCTEGIDDSYKTSATTRYANLSYTNNPTPNIPRRYFIAMNLHNNLPIIPDLFFQLFRTIAHLGPPYVFLSIYENGSTDDTPAHLQTTLVRALDALGVDHSITTSTERRPDNAHRIQYLARVRNRALNPLHALATGSYNLRYDRVLFLNDVLFCRDDLFELLYQQHLQQSHITCGVDYDLQWGETPLFYDNWVARDINGLPFFKDPNKPIHDVYTLDRYRRNLPYQVYCCWNGATVLDPRPLYDHGVRFRAATPHPRKPDYEFSNTDESGGECGASECSLLCKDYWGAGFGRVITVPRVKVAYEPHVYTALHQRPHEIGTPADGQFWPRDWRFDEEEGLALAFRKPPRAQYCVGYHDHAIIAPWDTVMWEDVPVSEHDPLRPAE